MGGSSSKSSIQIVTDIVTDVVVNVALNSASNQQAVQNVTYSGFTFFGWTSQSSYISQQALSNVQVTNEMLTQMSQKIMQAAASSAISFLPSVAKTTTSTTIQNKLKNTITTNFITNCAASMTASQTVNYNGIQIGVATTQELDSYNKCVMNGISNTSLITDLGIDTSNDNKATADTASWLTSMVNTYGYMVIAIVLGVVVLIVGLAYSIFAGGDGESSHTPVPVYYGPPINQGDLPVYRNSNYSTGNNGYGFISQVPHVDQASM
jgi:hypothetical protein